MAQAKEGQEFIRHELDEAIAIQQSIVEAERQLSAEHPLPEAKKELESMAAEDEQQLRELEQLGRQFGASGKREEVAQHMEELKREVSKHLKGGADSEKYEMHAVLLTLKRKQQDAAAALAEIAGRIGNADLRKAASRLHEEMRSSADRLAASLAKLATEIASRGAQPSQAR